jgi:hypothetical protein
MSARDFAGQMSDQCPVCRMPSVHLGDQVIQTNCYRVVCARCGEYLADRITVQQTLHKSFSKAQQVAVSGYIRENQGMRISTSDWPFLMNLAMPSVADKAMKLLRWLSNQYPHPGVDITVPAAAKIDSQVEHFNSVQGAGFSKDVAADNAAIEMFPFLSGCWAESGRELHYLLYDYLCDAYGYLSGAQGKMVLGGYQPSVVRVAPMGWQKLQETSPSDSVTGFVAMWFNSEMDLPWEKAFYPAIREAGYSPLRIDKKEHNNKIDDEIISAIRSAKFLIGDFTGDRGGVYYEAGFAAGLGRPVIWTVRRDWFDKVHFDTRQYNHLIWDESNLDLLKSMLKNRIEATLGRGPLRF